MLHLSLSIALMRVYRGASSRCPKPGERRVVSFTLTPSDLEFYDLQMQRVVEARRFQGFCRYQLG